MIEYRNESDKTYMLEASITHCSCEECEELRKYGNRTYEACAYLGDMLIGFDCGARSGEEAIESAEVLCLMFENGELGANPLEFFTPEAIKHVMMRKAGAHYLE